MSVIDGSLAVQAAIMAALKADAGILAITGTGGANARVYDVVPASASKPYISFGTIQVLPERATSYAGAGVSITVDGWDGGPAGVVIKKLGGAIIDALDGAELPLGDGQRLVSLEVEQTNYLKDPDGQTQHVAVTLMALTEPSV